jgi:two-component system, cell cycle sensor histidine kinase and response regulator CckA
MYRLCCEKSRHSNRCSATCPSEPSLSCNRCVPLRCRNFFIFQAPKRSTVVNQSERGKSEECLHQAQKIDALGRLAGGIAHDFNGLLQIILGYTELSIALLGRPDHPVHMKLLEIEKAARSGDALVRQLLAFTRQQVLQYTILDLNSIVRDADRMLSRLIGEDIEILLNLGADLEPVRSDPGQIMQVILNLATNARDSMPHGGKLMIETANMTIHDCDFEDSGAARPGQYVVLSVTDTGIGMDEQTQARMFDPFFTTKGLGHGTGLGLATVYRIVKLSDGYILVYSGVGRGTSFKILLPKASRMTEASLPEAVSTPAPKGSETVLLVEDTDQVRKLVCQLLEMSGYKVLTAGSSAEALDLAGAYEGLIHLVLTDVVMPGMSGYVLVEQLLSNRPQIKMLLMSGYTDDRITHGALSKGDFNFIQKPFSHEALAGKVREVLDGASNVTLRCAG